MGNSEQLLEDHRVRAILHCFGQSPEAVGQITPLRGGYLNRSVVVTVNNEQMVLRIYMFNREYHSILYEHDLLLKLPAIIHTAAVPKPRRTLDGHTLLNYDGLHYALFPYLLGQAISDVPKEEVDLREVGRTLAAYHNTVSHIWKDRHTRRTHGDIRFLDWSIRYAGGVTELLERAGDAAVLEIENQLVLRHLHFLREEEATTREALVESRYSQLYHVVAHNDFSGRNVLWDSGRVSGILDYDFANWDARLTDVAIALFWFSENLNAAEGGGVSASIAARRWHWDADRARSLLQGYGAEIEVEMAAPEVMLLPIAFRRFGCWLALSYLDLRLGGLSWYPEECWALLASLSAFRDEAVDFVAMAYRGC